MDTTAAASTLTRQRFSVAVLSLAAAATLGYFCYRIYSPPLPEPSPDRRLHRSNAVRHRRRSLPDVTHTHAHTHANDRGRDREPSEASTTSAETQPDENIDVNTVRPLNDAETVADEHVLDDNWYDDANNQFGGLQQRAGQNIVSLLFRVSEDNARRNAYVHRGCQCNSCGVTPIRGIRYRCANCVDFDLCEACESQGFHIKTHVFYKIRVPIPRLGARQLQPTWYPGDPDNCLRPLPKHLMPRLSKETGFERPELEALWEQWTFMANTEWREDPDELGLAMDRKTFERYLVPSGGYRHIAPNLLHDRMFAFYDDNNDDLIGFSEFLRGTAYRKRKDRLRRIFNGYDIDGDGYVSRRDFLRLFRAYYVVFKHLHKDIVDGLDDQLMSSTDVEQLVTSRQPLSSLFGREGGIAEADLGRPLEGKVVNLHTGEVRVTDGATRAVNESAPDTADRRSVLTSVYTRQAHGAESLFGPVTDNPRPAGERASGLEYLSGLLNPPSRVNELPALLVGERRDNGDFLFVLNGRGGQEGSGEAQETQARGEDAPTSGDHGTSASGEDRAEDRLGANGSSDGGVADEPDMRRPAYSAVSSRRIKVNARRKLFDRWKRRQFYLDEEEGVLPPEDWSDDDDVLASLSGPADDTKACQPPLSSRSRSSSKVRFAEDADDFDVRSNPSTSSRSIPERWGGMEIPDAERDVGKEIFYQVIQQAFNEMLDTIFKEKEDLAVQAAETKELRDKYRHAFESINPDEENEPQANLDSASGRSKSPRDQSLQELPDASGYSVDPAAAQPEGHPREEVEDDEDDGETSAEEDDDSLPPLIAEDERSGSAEFEVYRDPTMPQFRPNSIPTVREREPKQREPPSSSSVPSIEGVTPPETRVPPSAPGKPTSMSAGTGTGARGSASPVPIPRSTLIQWRRLDLAEEEAKTRGGWGRLNYDEFERAYKAADARGTRMDYLGTWVDFCIPCV